MKYEELIAQLCEVIKESENNAKLIYDNTEIINTIISDLEIPYIKKTKLEMLFLIFLDYCNIKIYIDKRLKEL